MTYCHSGLVKGDAEQIGRAFDIYLVKLGEAANISKALEEKSKIDTRERRTWYGRKIQVTVHELIRERLREDWFGTVYSYLREYYPNDMTLEQVILLKYVGDSAYHMIKPLYDYNPTEVYLTAEQADWVVKWSNVK
jgi:hypothetical protein